MPEPRRNPTITFQADREDLDRLDALVRQLTIYRQGKPVKRSQVIRAAIYAYAEWVHGGKMPANILTGLH